jgi:hypothetical protein
MGGAKMTCVTQLPLGMRGWKACFTGKDCTEALSSRVFRFVRLSGQHVLMRGCMTLMHLYQVAWMCTPWVYIAWTAMPRICTALRSYSLNLHRMGSCSLDGQVWLLQCCRLAPSDAPSDADIFEGL